MNDELIIQYILQKKYRKAIDSIKNIVNMYSYSKTLPFLLCSYLLLFPKDHIDEVLRIILSKCNIMELVDTFEEINNLKYEEKLINYYMLKNKLFPQYDKTKIKLSEKQLNILKNLLTTSPLYYKLNDDIYEYNVSVYIHNTYDIYDLLSISSSIRFTIHIMELYRQHSELVKILNDLDENNVNIVYIATLYDELVLQLLDTIKITQRLFLITCNRCSNSVIKHILNKDVNICSAAFKNILCRSITVLCDLEIDTVYFYISNLFENLTIDAFKFNIFNKRNKTTITTDYNFKPVPVINIFLLDHKYKPTKHDLLACLKVRLFIHNPQGYGIDPETDEDIKALCKRINFDPYVILDSSKALKYKQMDITKMTYEQICRYKDLEDIDKYYENIDSTPSKECIKLVIKRHFIDLFIAWAYKYSLPLDDKIIELLVTYSDKKELINIMKLYNRQYEERLKEIKADLLKNKKENMDLKYNKCVQFGSETSSPINSHISKSSKSSEESSSESNIVKPTNITILKRKIKDKTITIKIHP